MPLSTRQGATVADLLQAIEADPELADLVRHHRVLASRPAQRAMDFPVAEPLDRWLEGRGIPGLYRHQAEAIEALEKGRDVVLATPTASGKSLVYALPTLAASLQDPEARALYVFPLKALAQDQRAKLEADAAALGLLQADGGAWVDIYDGDTPTSRRKRIRETPPTVLITTPDMLHAGILPHHASWHRFFRNLRLVVIDELHGYRGIFGSHVAQVLRRLERVSRHHGARPCFVCASATVANPGELAANLTGREFTVVSRDAAARHRRHVLLVNPTASPYTTAARLFRLSVRMGLRTIAFTKARRVTELMHTWVREAEPALAGRISSYRAGFLPEERRQIEGRLFRGDLLGVISTSALEMGIDVGGLDVCLLVGYPGSQIATWQRAGRVGRSRDALVALVAQPDALDQYLVHHPAAFFGQAFEHAVLDPCNPEILAAHLPCAAAEVPLRAAEPWLQEPAVDAALHRLEEAGGLLRSESGGELFAARRNPHREISLRSAGAHYTICAPDPAGGRPLLVGTIGAAHVMTECHEGAIYLHRSRQYRVTRLDLDERKVTVEPVEAVYFTRALAEKETEILSRDRARPVGNVRLVEGRVKVTTRVTGYERRRVRGQDLLSTEPLDLPPSTYETRSIWLEIPDEIPALLQTEGRHVMGGIHAVEHAALALFPLFALCDRFDVAGISQTRHPQLGRAAIFFYDGFAGGAGLVASAFDRLEPLLEATLEMVRDCPCEAGCPACVHSPRCGNGNRPIDKAAAIRVLELVLAREPLPAPTEAPAAQAPPARDAGPAATAPEEAPPVRLVFFDLETQRGADEVGGWHNAHLMRVALAVTWDSVEGAFRTWREADVPALLETLGAADLVVGFNVLGFDYRVLRGYTDRDLSRLPTFDMLDAIHRRIGFRLSLGHLGEETLGEAKSADGLQSLRWWREGRVDEIERYCRKDVAILRDLFAHARDHGHLLFRTRRGERVRVPLRLRMEELLEAARPG